MSFVTDNLAVCEFGDIGTQEQFKTHGFTAQLQCAEPFDPWLADCVEVKCLPFDDGAPIPRALFWEAQQWLSNHWEAGGKILISCAAGQSRSVTMAASLLCRETKIAFLDAALYILGRIPTAYPHPRVIVSAASYCGPPLTLEALKRIYAGVAEPPPYPWKEPLLREAIAAVTTHAGHSATVATSQTAPHRDAAAGTLEQAIAIAALAHQGQTDKAGAPYILHPLRVMMPLDSLEERIVAVLHDVVEDSPWTLDALAAEGFSSAVIDALRSVTKREGEAYEDFVRRAGRNPISAKVKLADLRDNSDLSRIANPTEEDHRRLKKYQRAMRLLAAGRVDTGQASTTGADSLDDTPTLLVLDDSQTRLRGFEAIMRKFDGWQLKTWVDAPSMIADLDRYLSKARLISLDHDLYRQAESDPDPGKGRDVAEHLAGRTPVCPVIVHSTNTDAAWGMFNCLQAKG